MNKLSVAKLKTWAKTNRTAAKSVRTAQEFAQSERDRVDAYTLPVFAKYEFYADIHDGSRIESPKDLYLSSDDEQCEKFYADCDRANRENGFEGGEGYCPALIAEGAKIDAENDLLRSLGNFVGVDFNATTLELREKALDLAMETCLNL